MPFFSIVIPTFDHGKLIREAIESVRGQQEKNWELCIIGDGSPLETEKLARDYEKQDNRIRFFPNVKGPRNGEIYRDEIIRQHTTGKYICYLSDDDLYFPDHLTLLKREFAQGYNFVSSFAVGVMQNQGFYYYAANLRLQYYQQLLLGGENRVPLSNGAHSRTLYNQLPYGWRTTPQGTPTDLYMWQQFLSSPAVRPTTVLVPTVLHFASPERKNVSQSARLTELHHWRHKISANPAKLRSKIGEASFAQMAETEPAVALKTFNTCRAENQPDKEALNQIYDSKIGWVVRAYFSVKDTLRKLLFLDTASAKSLHRID